MELEFEMSGFPGLTNHVSAIPGTDVTCHMGVFDARPDVWSYSLWVPSCDASGESLVSSGHLDFTGLPVTPQQVARVAFLLDVEYGF